MTDALWIIPGLTGAAFLAAVWTHCRLTRTPPPPPPPVQVITITAVPDDFPDTGPLWVRSERSAANDALGRDVAVRVAEFEREVRELADAAEQRIPERWRR